MVRWVGGRNSRDHQSGRSLDECRQNLRDSLELMIETHRDEARFCLDASCIQEAIEIDVIDPGSTAPHHHVAWRSKIRAAKKRRREGRSEGIQDRIPELLGLGNTSTRTF